MELKCLVEASEKEPQLCLGIGFESLMGFEIYWQNLVAACSNLHSDWHDCIQLWVASGVIWFDQDASCVHRMKIKVDSSCGHQGALNMGKHLLELQRVPM